MQSRGSDPPPARHRASVNTDSALFLSLCGSGIVSGFRLARDCMPLPDERGVLLSVDALSVNMTSSPAGLRPVSGLPTTRPLSYVGK